MTTTLIILSIAIAWTALAFATGVVLGHMMRGADDITRDRDARRKPDDPTLN